MTIFIIILSLCLNPLWVPIALRVKMWWSIKTRNTQLPPLLRISSSPPSMSLSSHWGAEVCFPAILGRMCPGFLLPGIHSLSPPNPMPTEGISSWSFRSMALLSESLPFCPWSASPATHCQTYCSFSSVSLYLLMTIRMINWLLFSPLLE